MSATQISSTHTQCSDATEMGRQQLASLPPAHRAVFYEQTLVQPGAIHILSDGAFSKVERQPASMWQLTIPTHADDALAAEAAEVFYSHNEFAVSVNTIPHFIAWWVGNYFRPSDLVTQLAVLYGPSREPGGGNSELQHLLSMSRLGSVRLLFRDSPVKGLGPHSYLRPSAWAIMELQKRVALTLQLKDDTSWPPDDDTNTLEGPLRDITSYLDAPTTTDEWAFESSQRIVEQYRGPSASNANILREYGWSSVTTEGLSELYARMRVRRWAEEQRLEMMDSHDVEMS